MEVLVALASNPKFWGVIASLLAIVVGLYYQFLSDKARKKRAEAKRKVDDAKKEQELDESYRAEQASKKKSRDQQKRVAENWDGHHESNRN